MAFHLGLVFFMTLTRTLKQLSVDCQVTYVKRSLGEGWSPASENPVDYRSSKWLTKLKLNNIFFRCCFDRLVALAMAWPEGS